MKHPVRQTISHYTLGSLAMALICLFILSGCGQSNAPLRVALVEWPPYELAFWAQQNGKLDPDKVTLLEYKTPAEVTRAFANGAVDIIAVTTDYALSLSAEHPDTRIFLVIDASNGGDVVLSRKSSFDASDLSGKTIAVEAGPLGTYMLSRFMDHFKIPSGTLNIEYVDIPQQLEHWQKHDVDFLITYEPNKTRLIKEGAKVIFSSKEIPNEIVDVFLAREATIKDRKDDLVYFSQAWFQAVQVLHSNDPEIFQFISEKESVPVADIQAAMTEIIVPTQEQNLRLLNGQDSALIRGLALNEKIMLGANLLSKPVNKNNLLTPAVLQEID